MCVGAVGKGEEEVVVVEVAGVARGWPLGVGTRCVLPACGLWLGVASCSQGLGGGEGGTWHCGIPSVALYSPLLWWG